MPLVEETLPVHAPSPPGDVRRFLREAERRIRRFRRHRRLPGFIPCDFARAHGVLRALAEAGRLPGDRFCEWGSGFGVVACLAALLDLDAVGIEVEEELVEEARRLAGDFELPAEFIHGSFIPPGHDVGEGFAWLAAEAAASADPDADPGGFDVIFAYPWPDEEAVTAELFEAHARGGALLITYHGVEDLRVRRKA